MIEINGEAGGWRFSGTDAAEDKCCHSLHGVSIQFQRGISEEMDNAMALARMVVDQAAKLDSR
jgi:hypothetical protein